MRHRLRALLVHGMGNDPSWWDSVAADLAAMEIGVETVTLPCLEDSGPESWVDEVVRRANGNTHLLVGHSLGAAVALQAARLVSVEGVVLLACPVSLGPSLPSLPPGVRLSLTAVARVARFLRKASAEAADVCAPVAHFVGDVDPYVSLDQASRLPHPLSVVPGAGHELNDSLAFRRALCRHIAATDYGRARLDPAIRCSQETRGSDHPAEDLLLDEVAASPARLDVEITTRCQLTCRRCARAHLPASALATELSLEVFERVLDGAEFARELIFVGLGEPLLHAQLEPMVARSAQRGVETKLVTNGLLATPERLARLADEGLAEVTFSIDTTDPALFRRLRGGAALDVVLQNFRAVPAPLRRSLFATLSRENADQIPGLVDLAVDVGLKAIAVSDVNFAENQADSLHESDAAAALVDAIRYSRERGVLLITPRFHDVGDAPRNYRRCLARLPADLTGRSSRHLNCLAPWRIAVVGADGALTPCNCAPRKTVGSVARDGLGAVWNGSAMRAWRRKVRQSDSPACAVCPRF